MKRISPNYTSVVGIVLCIGLVLAICPTAFAMSMKANSESTQAAVSSSAQLASAELAEVCNQKIDDFGVETTDVKEDSVLRAISCLGAPYATAGAGPDSFDCSGLVSYALTGQYCHAYTSYDFWAMPEVDDPKPGDVVACSSGHCGLYVGDGLMIHAPQTGEFVRIEAVRGKIVRP